MVRIGVRGDGVQLQHASADADGEEGDVGCACRRRRCGRGGVAPGGAVGDDDADVRNVVAASVGRGEHDGGHVGQGAG